MSSIDFEWVAVMFNKKNWYALVSGVPPFYILSICFFCLIGFGSFCAGLFLHHQTIEQFRQSEMYGQQLLSVERDLLDLSRQAARTRSYGYASGSESGGIAGLTDSYQAEYNDLHQRLAKVEENMKRRVDTGLDESLLFHIDASKSSLFSFHESTLDMFGALQKSDMMQAASAMSFAEAQFAKFSDKIVLATEDIRDTLRKYNQQQLINIERHRTYFVGTVIVAVLSGLALVLLVFAAVSGGRFTGSDLPTQSILRVGNAQGVRVFGEGISRAS